MFKHIHDVNLVAYLIAKGFKQAEPPKYQNGQVLFTFDDPKDEIPGIINHYYGRDTSVDALTHAELIRNLKSQLIMIKRNAQERGQRDE